MKVYVVIETKHVDYHGSYDNIIDIYSNEEDAQNAVEQLSINNTNYDTDYTYNTYNVR